MSAVHYAMLLYFRDPLAFWSEYQNWIETPNCPSSPLESDDLRIDAGLVDGGWALVTQ